MTNITYKDNNRFLTGFIEWPKVYFGSKKWEYEIEFDAQFKNLISGTIYQYDENDDYLDCYPLCDPDLPDENFKLQIDNRIFNQNYFDPLDDEAKTETKAQEILQADSLQIMKTEAPETYCNLLYLILIRITLNTLDTLIRITLHTISTFLRSINIDSSLLRKYVNPKKHLVHNNEESFVEEYQTLK